MAVLSDGYIRCVQFFAATENSKNITRVFFSAKRNDKETGQPLNQTGHVFARHPQANGSDAGAPPRLHGTCAGKQAIRATRPGA